MNIAVTGGSGFIGSHLVDQLIEKGHEVSVLDTKKPHRDDAKYIEADILDTASMVKALKDIEVVYHLAAASNVNFIHKDPVNSVALNVDGTVNVLEGARQNDVKRVILASTVWLYGGSPGSMANEESMWFSSGAGHIYTSTKIASEMLCHDYKDLYGVPFTILRYGIPYGPRARPETVIAIFLNKALNNEPLTIQGDGSQFRYFIYVEDLAQGNVLALNDVAKNEIYNLDGKEAITIKQIADTINELFDGKIKITYTDARPGDYKGKYVSTDKALRELGWKPEITFEEGMKRYVDWVKKNKK